MNKRVRFLEESEYLKKIGVRKTKAGFEASTYELAAKAYLAILLSSTTLDELITGLDETTASIILAGMTDVIDS